MQAAHAMVMVISDCDRTSICVPSSLTSSRYYSNISHAYSLVLLLLLEVPETSQPSDSFAKFFSRRSPSSKIPASCHFPPRHLGFTDSQLHKCQRWTAFKLEPSLPPSLSAVKSFRHVVISIERASHRSATLHCINDSFYDAWRS